jgi:hypothetical protein
LGIKDGEKDRLDFYGEIIKPDSVKIHGDEF